MQSLDKAGVMYKFMGSYIRKKRVDLVLVSSFSFKQNHLPKMTLSLMVTESLGCSIKAPPKAI